MKESISDREARERREIRLQSRRERERQRRAGETAEQKEARFSRQRERYRARRQHCKCLMQAQARPKHALHDTSTRTLHVINRLMHANMLLSDCRVQQHSCISVLLFHTDK